MMKQKDLENQLKNALHLPEVSVKTTHFDKTLLQLKREQECRVPREHMRFGTFILMQLRFIGWKIYLTQGFIWLMLYILFSMSWTTIFLCTPRHVATALCCVSILVPIMAVPFIRRAWRYQMHELEFSTYFSSARLLAANLCVIAAGDLLLLLGIVFLTRMNASFQTNDALLYVLFPFLLSSSVYLYLLGHTPAQRFPVYCAAMCALLIGILTLADRFYPHFFLQSFSPVHLVLCLTGAIACASQFHHAVHHFPNAQMQHI